MIKKQTYLSIWQYLLRICLIGLIIFVLLFSIGDNSNQLLSLITSSIIFLLATVIATRILFQENKWIKFFTLAYLIKVFIGLGHYLYFIDGSYFKGSGEYKSITFEYESVFRGICEFAKLKLEKGLFYFNANAIEATHPEILSFISIPFMFFGEFVLSISPINAFFSLLISINIILISKYKYKFSDEKLKYIALVTAYFPLTLIPSLLWRDVIGMSIMSIGITMISLSRQSLFQYFLVICVCYLFYLQRTVYPILLALAYVTDIVFNKPYRSTSYQKIYKFITLLLISASLPVIYQLGNTDSNIAMASGILNFNPLFLPIKFVLGLIGPFPWTNFLLYKLIPANAYHLQDFLQGMFNISFVIIMFKYKFFKARNISLLNIIGIFLILSGLLNSYMHMPYVSFGFIFLIPWLFYTIKLNKFKSIYKLVFIGMIVLNLLVIQILGNLGISSIWR